MKFDVLSYSPPFPWLLKPCCGYRYRLLDSISAMGVKSLAVIIKNYQRDSFYQGYPDVLPANQFETLPCTGEPAGGGGGTIVLRQLRNHVVNDLLFPFALHENYVDLSPSAPSHLPDHSQCALDRKGVPLLGWASCTGEVAHIMKPSVVKVHAGRWSTRLADSVGPTWSYSDVATALDPSSRVDYDASVDGAGMYAATLQAYRSLPSILRTAYGGPVQGEGGYHMLYAGYYDDFEARLYTADPTLRGHRAPLLVDFDLMKIRPKSALHGTGHYESFFADSNGTEELTALGDDQIWTFMATEVAYGHGGLVTKHLLHDHCMQQTIMEGQHLHPLREAWAEAEPVTIEYWDGDGDGPFTISEYIERHRDWDDPASGREFLSRVKVTYSNGVVVAVNRNRQPWVVSGIGNGRGWLTYFESGQGQPASGRDSRTSFQLHAEYGWVGFVP